MDKIKGSYMKAFFLALLIVVSMGCGATEHNAAKSGPLVGVISTSQLLEQYPKFRSEYDQYQPSSADISALAPLSGMSVVVLFGTWCHDSEREVPRLLKLLDLSGVKLQNLSLHGINFNKEEPTDLHLQFDLKHSPTIILLQGENELGRIVEQPVVSLAQDLASFVANP